MACITASMMLVASCASAVAVPADVSRSVACVVLARSAEMLRLASAVRIDASNACSAVRAAESESTGSDRLVASSMASVTRTTTFGESQRGMRSVVQKICGAGVGVGVAGGAVTSPPAPQPVSVTTVMNATARSVARAISDVAVLVSGGISVSPDADRMERDRADEGRLVVDGEPPEALVECLR